MHELDITLEQQVIIVHELEVPKLQDFNLRCMSKLYSLNYRFSYCTVHPKPQIIMMHELATLSNDIIMHERSTVTTHDKGTKKDRGATRFNLVCQDCFGQDSPEDYWKGILSQRTAEQQPLEDS